MAHHDVVENNPVKEIMTSLIGIVLLVAIIAGIAIFAWIRPAGYHAPAETGQEVAAQAQTSEQAAPAQ